MGIDEEDLRVHVVIEGHNVMMYDEVQTKAEGLPGNAKRSAFTVAGADLHRFAIIRKPLHLESRELDGAHAARHLHCFPVQLTYRVHIVVSFRTPQALEPCPHWLHVQPFSIHQGSECIRRVKTR